MLLAAEGGSTDLQKEFYSYCKELGIDAGKETGNGSDHVSFTARGVEAVLLINEDFLNGYHTPGDTMEDVDKSRLEEITKLVLYYVDKNAY
jgi:Zn-dependent M28 family amino/carboxypeptidase